MSDFDNPAFAAFLSRLPEELEWGQVLIRRMNSDFELRHVADESKQVSELKRTDPAELRDLALNNGRGQFRPLKSAPDLCDGWFTLCSGNGELEFALNQLYPNSIIDWYSAALPDPPITNYRQFTNRQSGMYRITQMLTNEQAANVIKAACHPSFCFKRRLWSVERLAADAPETKSAIPCLEPCAILLEWARKAMRIEQDQKLTVEI